MMEAIKIAEKYEPFPNPKVGVVAVKNGRIVFKAAHKIYGSKHAEQILLEKLNDIKDCEIYLTLEPCVEFEGKKTPACSRLLHKAGLKKLYVAMMDPNPKVNGRGIEFLRKNGVDVKTGIMLDEAKKLNYKYIRFIKKNTPYIMLKWAMTMDGKISDYKMNSKYITKQETRKFTRDLRKKFDAVMIGKNTLLKDNPELKNSRHVVLIDKNLEIPLNLSIFRHKSKITIITAENLNSSLLKRFNKAGCRVVEVKNIGGVLDMREAMMKLRATGINSIMCEGGGETNWYLVKEGLVDEVLVIVAPSILGGEKSVTPVEGMGLKLINALQFDIMDIERIGSDILIRYVHRNY